MRIIRVTIDRAELRELIDEAVHEGDDCYRDYVGQGISHSEYYEAIEVAIDGMTDKVLALINKDGGK